MEQCSMGTLSLVPRRKVASSEPTFITPLRISFEGVAISNMVKCFLTWNGISILPPCILPSPHWLQNADGSKIRHSISNGDCSIVYSVILACWRPLCPWRRVAWSPSARWRPSRSAARRSAAAARRCAGAASAEQTRTNSLGRLGFGP